MTARAVMARALYDFTGDPAVRQLTFKKNDLIKVTHQYENGWWAGELNGKAGYLPSTYIKIEEARTTPATSPGGGKSTLTAPVQPASTSKPSPPTAPKPSTPSSGGGLATYSVTSGAGPQMPSKPQPQTKPPPPARTPPPENSLTRSQGAPPSAVPPTRPPPQQPPSRGPVVPAATPPRGPVPATNPPVNPRPTPPSKPAPASYSTNRPSAPDSRPLASSQGWANASTPGSDVNESDFSELDSLIKSLQDEVLDLKKLL